MPGPGPARKFLPIYIKLLITRRQFLSPSPFRDILPDMAKKPAQPSFASQTAISINGMEFNKIPGVSYYSDYAKIHELIVTKAIPEVDALRALVLNDLWFIVYFVMGWPASNHKFIVDACREIECGPQTQTLDLWFREGGKSTVITVARSIQEVLRNPNERICIFSYARSPALSFLRQIKFLMEGNELLRACFPDVLYQVPDKDSPKWSEMEGLVVKRRGAQKECTFEAHGLLEGMPTGKHFSLLIFDDVVTADLVQTPDIMEKVKERFDMALNVGTAEGRHRVVGTFYHHEDPLNYIMAKKDVEGKALYHTRIKPATEDGSFNGASVFLPEQRLSLLRSNRRQFYCQQLLDPTPMGEAKLEYSRIIQVQRENVPNNLFKFMVVDPAGSAGTRTDGRRSDDWACWVVGVKPCMGEKGLSDIFILDGFIEALPIDKALDKIVLMYCNAGRVLKVGVEKMGAMTFEIHVSNALRAKGRHISIEAGTLHILNPAGRKKEMRIEQNLIWPLNNGRVHISSSVPSHYKDRLKMEMEKFPAWRDDGIDALAYVYDIINDYRFGTGVIMDEAESRKWWEEERRNKSKYNWMTA